MPRTSSARLVLLRACSTASFAALKIGPSLRFIGQATTQRRLWSVHDPQAVIPHAEAGRQLWVQPVKESVLPPVPELRGARTFGIARRPRPPGSRRWPDLGLCSLPEITNLRIERSLEGRPR